MSTELATKPEPAAARRRMGLRIAGSDARGRKQTSRPRPDRSHSRANSPGEFEARRQNVVDRRLQNGKRETAFGFRENSRRANRESAAEACARRCDSARILW